VFFSTLFSYNFQRITRHKKIAVSTPNAWVVENKKVAKCLLFISLIGAFVFVPIFEQPFALGWMVLLGIVSFGYSYRKLRDIPHLKIILIAASWGIACGIIPLEILGYSSVMPFLLSFGWIFLYILAITIPFDIRDLAIDEKSKKTLPQWLGVQSAKLVALICLLFSWVLLWSLIPLYVWIGFLVSFILAGLLIIKSNSSRKDFYYTFLVDGHIILQFLIVYFFH